MQISNRANGDDPQDELNKRLQLTFSDGYTTEVNVLVQSLSGIQGLGDIPHTIIHSDQSPSDHILVIERICSKIINMVQKI